ncbi:MAG: small multi-drug export protein [Clostridia bacterium]|nr:small multi-drug export protein [Clostridia bacterium]
MFYYLLTFLISMVPVIELRGAIPFGIGYGLNEMLVILIAIVGNMVPIPFLVLFGGKVLGWLAKFPRLGKPFRKILKIGEKKVAKMHKTLFWGLFVFVAIPLPGTGAWTGALISIILGLDLKRAVPPITLGVVTAGLIMLILSVTARGVFELLI